MLKRMRPANFDGVITEETVITRTASLRGTIKSDANVKILGTFEGTIDAAGLVMVGPDGSVTADINARHIAVAGIVRGNITAAGRVEILTGGEIHGDVASSSLRIEEGALFSGRSTMTVEEPGSLLVEAIARPAMLEPANGSVTGNGSVAGNGSTATLDRGKKQT